MILKISLIASRMTATLMAVFTVPTLAALIATETMTTENTSSHINFDNPENGIAVIGAKFKSSTAGLGDGDEDDCGTTIRRILNLSKGRLQF